MIKRGRLFGRLQRRLDLHRQYVVIYHQHAYTQLPLLTFTREVLELAPGGPSQSAGQNPEA